MKTLTKPFSLMLMLALLTLATHAQTTAKIRNDSSKRISRPYYYQTASWWDSGNGFICKVTADNRSYLTRYDKQGNYLETLVQKTWNEKSDLWPSFMKSQHKSLKVIAYWEVWDVGRKGYYLEMIDNRNQVSNVWADESGNFSTIPSTKSKQ